MENSKEILSKRKRKKMRRDFPQKRLQTEKYLLLNISISFTSYSSLSTSSAYAYILIYSSYELFYPLNRENSSRGKIKTNFFHGFFMFFLLFSSFLHRCLFSILINSQWKSPQMIAMAFERRFPKYFWVKTFQ